MNIYDTLPVASYTTLDLLYDIKTFGDAATAINDKYWQGRKLSKKDIRFIVNTLKKDRIFDTIQEIIMEEKNENTQHEHTWT